MAADHYMGAVGRGRRQPPFQFFWTRLETFLEARGKRSATDKLFFQTGR
jgi:hypothetical protein